MTDILVIVEDTGLEIEQAASGVTVINPNVSLVVEAKAEDLVIPVLQPAVAGIQGPPGTGAKGDKGDTGLKGDKGDTGDVTPAAIAARDAAQSAASSASTSASNAAGSASDAANSASAAAASAAASSGASKVSKTGDTMSGSLIVSTATNTVQYRAQDGTVDYAVGYTSGSNIGYHGTMSNHPLALITNNTERLRISADGLVGVGTSGPWTALSVNGPGTAGVVTSARQFGVGFASGYQLAMGYYQSNTSASYSGVLQALDGGNGTILALNPSGGLVGIGTRLPSYTLDVANAGAVTVANFQGAVRFAGGPANVGGMNRAALEAALHLDGQGNAALAWNYSAGGGETDLFINRDGGGSGGFHIYDFPNTSGLPTSLSKLDGGSTGAYYCVGNDDPLRANGYSSIRISGPSAGSILALSAAGTEAFRVQYDAGTAVYLNAITSVPIVLKTDGTERMRINAVGNVGIGADPGTGTFRLYVKSSTAGQDVLQYLENGNGTHAAIFRLKAGLSQWSGFQNLDGSDNVQWMIGSTGVVGGIGFAAGGSSEKMRLSSSGNLLVGGTSDIGRVAISQSYDQTNPALALTQPVASWGTIAAFLAYRFLKTSAAATDGNFRTFQVGAGGVAIGYANTPAYGSDDAFYINGRVGIGTTSPSTYLDCGGGINTRGGTSSTNGYVGMVGGDGTHTGYMEFRKGDTSRAGYLGYADGSTLNLFSEASGQDIAFGTGNSERVRFTHDGRVGIGTSNPGFLLDAVAGSGLTARFQNTNTSQFSAGGIVVAGPSSLGTQGGAMVYVANNNAGATQGSFSIAQSDYVGNWQRTLANYDYTNQNWDFYTNTSLTMRMIGGNVLIGDSNNSGYRLGLQTANLGTTSGNTALAIRSYTYTGNGDLFEAFYLRSASGSNWDTADLVLRRNVDGSGFQSEIRFLGSNATSFYQNGSERMRLSIAGDLLIGTTTDPGQRLSVVGQTLTPGTQASYAVGIANAGGANNDLTLGSNGSNTYIQSWGGKPLNLNSQGNATIFGPGAVTIPKFASATAAALGYATPQMYGAVGDGTTDDSTAVENALNSGYPVRLIGKFKLTRQINVNLNNAADYNTLYVQGAGHNASAFILAAAAACITVWVSFNGRVVMRDVGFEASYAGVSNGLRILGSPNVGSVASNFLLDGVFVRATSGWISTGFFIQDARNGTITNCNISGSNGTTGSAIVLYPTNASSPSDANNAPVDFNIFGTHTTGFNCGIEIRPSGDTGQYVSRDIQGVHITDCTLLVNNIGVSHVSSEDTSGSVMVTGTTFASAQYCCYFKNSRFSRVINNHIQASADNWIGVYAEMTYADYMAGVVSNNTFYCAGFTGCTPIKSVGSVTRNIITNNMCIGTGSYVLASTDVGAGTNYTA